jgi:hypothetical protein
VEVCPISSFPLTNVKTVNWNPKGYNGTSMDSRFGAVSDRLHFKKCSPFRATLRAVLEVTRMPFILMDIWNLYFKLPTCVHQHCPKDFKFVPNGVGVDRRHFKSKSQNNDYYHAYVINIVNSSIQSSTRKTKEHFYEF